MLQTVVSIELPVGETLEIKKQTVQNGNGKKRISIVTGTHGDELEGQYVCYELLRRLRENKDQLNGIVDVYPALNPIGVDSMTRAVPLYDVDLNRTFPGNRNRALPSYLANEIVRNLRGSDVCIDIHASNVYLREVPQVRINEMVEKKLVPLAKRINIDFIWVHGAVTVLESTLAHSMNALGVPTLVVEMGVGLRVTRAFGEQLVEGIFSLMKDMGMWKGDAITPRESIISTDPEEVLFVNAPGPGLFVPVVEHGCMLQRGQTVGHILNPFTGEILHELVSEAAGWLFTLREFPNVYEGSLVARVLRRELDE